VVDIHATIDEELDIDVPVIVKLGGGKVVARDADIEELPTTEQMIPILIKRGMRAQLGTQSFLTGQLLISLKFQPEKEAVFRGDGSVPEIPTISSPLSEIQERLQGLPLQEISAKALAVLESIDRFVSSEELAASVRNLNQALVSVRGLSDSLDAQVEPLAASADDALSTLAEDSPTRYALDEALVELAAAARSIRVLAEYLERHPESLLAGKRGGGK
jgi:paraquat-inducible protein B